MFVVCAAGKSSSRGMVRETPKFFNSLFEQFCSLQYARSSLSSVSVLFDFSFHFFKK